MENASTSVEGREFIFPGVYIRISSNNVTVIVNRNRLPRSHKYSLVQSCSALLKRSRSSQEREELLDALIHYLQCKGELVNKQTWMDFGGSLGIAISFVGSWFGVSFLLKTVVILIPNTVPILVCVCFGLAIGVCFCMLVGGFLGMVLLGGPAFVINVRSQLPKSEKRLEALVVKLLKLSSEENRIERNVSEVRPSSSDKDSTQDEFVPIFRNCFFSSENVHALGRESDDASIHSVVVRENRFKN